MDNKCSRIRACALTLESAKNVKINPPISEVYDLASKANNCIVTDVKMPENHLGLEPEQDKVIVMYSGQDSARSAWARRLYKDADAATCDAYERIIRDANAELMNRRLLYKEVYIGRSEDFMIKAGLMLPLEWAKLALDFECNFIQINPETTEIFERRKNKIPDIKVVMYPEWNLHKTLDPEGKPILPELKRMSVIMDDQQNTAYLLGARYFGEVKKATLTMAWKTVVESGMGCGIHGSSKYLNVNTDKGLKAFSFITIGLSGSGKSTIGNDSHAKYMNTEKGEYTRLGNDDAVAVLFNAEKTIGFEDGCYNKTDSYSPDSFYIPTVLTAENVMVSRDENNKKVISHEDIYANNGRCISLRRSLPGAVPDVNVPWPDYITLIMKDETLPPVMMTEEPDLTAALFMSLATKPSAAENIPVDQIGKLKMIPGANPFIVYPMTLEAKTVEKMVEKTRCKCLIFNTSNFFSTSHENIDIPKELSLSIYPSIARGEIKWKDFVGPIKMADLSREVGNIYEPSGVREPESYWKLYNERINQRINFLVKLGLPKKYMNALKQVLK